MASNIDKVLVNHQFLQLCPYLTTITIPTLLSDHTLILISFKEKKRQDKNVPFSYINARHTLEGYDQCVI